MGFSAMLAEEYILIVPFAYHLHLRLTERNSAKEHDFMSGFICQIIKEGGFTVRPLFPLMDPGIPARRQAVRIIEYFVVNLADIITKSRIFACGFMQENIVKPC